ncbi:MAG: hypothetical protein KAG95_04475 [Bacteroidales bacterium]|nr:hypothetical protein [Bacteroidales bacterium]
MKIIKNIFISILVIIVFIITAGFIFAYFFEDEVNQLFVKQIDKHLTTKIDIKKIHFSVLKNFPNASVEFSEVVAFSTQRLNKKDFKNRTADTLFVAENFLFEFNIVDIINKKFNIHKIHIKNGEIFLAVDNKGNDNYHFFKSNKTNNESFNLKLKQIRLSNIKFIYKNLLTQTQFQAQTNKLSLQGNFSSDNYRLFTKGNFKLEKIIFGNVNYINTNEASLSLDIEVENNVFRVLTGRLSVSDLLFGISGDINIGEKNDININIKGKELSIESLISILPQKYSFIKKEYAGTGKVFFDTKIKGQISKFQPPHIETHFGVENATILNKKTKIKINKINAKGLFSTGNLNKPQSSYLKIFEYSAALNESSFSGALSFKNFNFPDLHIKINTDCNLEELQSFLKFKTIKSISGSLKAKIDFYDRIKNIEKYSFENFKNSLTGGTISLKNTKVQLTESDYFFSDVNSNMNFNGNDVNVEQMAFKTRNNSFEFKGQINNLISYLFEENHTLFIKGSVYSPRIVIDSLLEIETKNEQDKIKFPKDLEFKINIKAKEFLWDKFISKNLSGVLNYQNKSLFFNSLLFDSMKGNCSANGVFAQKSNGNFVLTTMADIDNIDIRKLFFSFSNFGQDFLKYNHLKGLCTANINLLSEWENNFDFISKTLYVTSSLTIKNGELVSFEPAKELSSFAKIEELKHIKFSTLTNDIMIKNEKVFIPEMEVNSSAFNLFFSGEQSFKGDISYKIRLLLSEVLAKKSSLAKKENSEFGIIEDDEQNRTSLYFLITGTTDDFVVKYDTKRVKKQIKKRFTQEKKVLKTILNEEFGLFKKDTSVIFNKTNKKEKKKTSKQPFIIEWNEEDTLTK